MRLRIRLSARVGATGEYARQRRAGIPGTQRPDTVCTVHDDFPGRTDRRAFGAADLVLNEARCGAEPEVGGRSRVANTRKSGRTVVDGISVSQDIGPCVVVVAVLIDGLFELRPGGMPLRPDVAWVAMPLESYQQVSGRAIDGEAPRRAAATSKKNIRFMNRSCGALFQFVPAPAEESHPPNEKLLRDSRALARPRHVPRSSSTLNANPW